MSRELELFSFDFRLLNPSTESLSCPNCGYQLERPISLLTRGLSKSLLILGCGSLLCLNYFKKAQLRSVLLDVGNALQYYGHSVLSFFNCSNIKSNSDNVYHHHETNYTITNQLTQCNNYNNVEDTTDLSFAFSSLSSNESSTVAKFDYLLDQVQQIKYCLADSYDELPQFQTSNHSLAERRLSDGEVTLSSLDQMSLEWDLGDLPLFAEHSTRDEFHRFGGKKQSFLYNVKYNGIIDPEVLSQIIFNKDFDFKEKIYDGINLKKYLTPLRNQLSLKYRDNLNSALYRSNRDSAFFEE